MKEIEMKFSDSEVEALFEIGRFYYILGYFVPAARIFSGLQHIDEGLVPTFVALGLLKLEGGLYAEASVYFRESISRNLFINEAKIGLAASYIGMGESSRAHSVLTQMKKDIVINNVSTEFLRLWESLVIRVS